ncbi:WxL domain-containing protein [Agrilactobacillus fermenti]|uniref:WxL domain-containing protein n=1 Tax=Agrilactobacillus fermenti TaxID=2586909 RepID=UPI001E2EC524|nr:WxL domain-containing protein [Agrilactobacillus fermenti]MCD2256532.1 WxL domain-containing protein [Agrilactobacillus fermenti]
MKKMNLGFVTLLALGTIGAVSAVAITDTNKVQAADDTGASQAGVEFTQQIDPLTITEVPSFHFGSQNVDNSKEMRYQTADSGAGSVTDPITTSKKIIVSDQRLGTNANGWHVQATLGDFTGITPTNKITTAKVALSNPGFTHTGSSTGVNLGGDGSTVEISSAVNTVLEADATMIGETTADFSTSADDVALVIPAGAVPDADTYEANIDWTLTAGPVATP